MDEPQLALKDQTVNSQVTPPENNAESACPATPAEQFLLKCYLCNSYIRSILDINEHVRQHLFPSGEISSAIPETVTLNCNVNVSNENGLTEHVYEYPNRSKEDISSEVPETIPLNCHLCNLNFSKEKDLAEHFRMHPDLKGCEDVSSAMTLNCHLCNIYFTTVKDLKEHVYEHLNERNIENGIPATSEVTTLNCSLCNLSFKLEKDLNDHLYITHENIIYCRDRICGVFVEGSAKGDDNEALSKENKKSKTYRCYTCEGIFTYEHELMSHFLTHFQIICEYCERIMFPCGTYRDSMKSEDLKLCLECKSFCVACKEDVPLEEAEDHILMHSWRIYACDLCPKIYPRNCDLRTHKLCHKEKIAYPCNQCGETFRFKQQLSAHFRQHSLKPPYLCRLCDKTFNSISVLRIHHCPDVTPNSHVCSQCGKSFIYKYSLDMHQLTHSPERLYLCNVCERGFREIINLVKHRLLHSIEKPHICHDCGIQYPYLNGFRKHLQNYHKENKPKWILLKSSLS